MSKKAEAIALLSMVLVGNYDDEVIVEAVNEAQAAATTAEAIRRVNRLGITVADNSRLLTIVLDKKVSYQHVRNTLERGEPKGTRRSSRKSIEEARKAFQDAIK